ncbi:MAG TPA: tRNA lysidine(34) synthetase TilS [Desulfobacterales bacterium]|nr:tRNA lysidine(34) synthetase TilS [Desulfobacterales bacterium]
MTTTLSKLVSTYIQTHRLIQPHDRVLVGVSGGPDSTALLHLLHRLAPGWPISLGVAHFDHKLRGADSQDDAAWVAKLAEALKLPFFHGEGDVRRHAQQEKISVQMAARQLRLEFFHTIRQRHHYHKLALGHTADDQLELFFLRLLRGSGPEGLKGMWPQSPTGIIRPLLGTPKTRILAWLASCQLPFREDASNLSRHYRRNQLRLDLLPQLLSYNPRLPAAVEHLQALLQEQEEYLSQEAAINLDRLQTAAAACPSLPVDGLLALPPAIQRRVLRLALAQAGVDLNRLTFDHVEAARKLAQRPQPAGEISLPGGWRLVRQYSELQFTKESTVPTPWEEFILPEQGGGMLNALGRTFTWTSELPAENYDFSSAHPSVALMDQQRLDFPLRLRTFRPGDRFQPLGMTGVKKLQDFFVDAKVPRQERPFIPLLLSREQIIWVVGYRLAETVKITAETHQIFKVEARAIREHTP